MAVTMVIDGGAGGACGGAGAGGAGGLTTPKDTGNFFNSHFFQPNVIICRSIDTGIRAISL